MPTPIAEKVKNTQSAFPPVPPGAVAPCPGNEPVAEEATMPVDVKNAFALTQDISRMTAAPAPAPQQKEKKAWIEIILVDMEGKPVPNERYKITPPGGGPPQEGRLNEHGQAGYYQIEEGTCKVTFPDLDQEAWE